MDLDSLWACVSPQEAVRAGLHGAVSPGLLPGPLLPVPPQHHAHPRVRALRHRLLRPRFGGFAGHGQCAPLTLTHLAVGPGPVDFPPPHVFVLVCLKFVKHLPELERGVT